MMTSNRRRFIQSAAAAATVGVIPFRAHAKQTLHLSHIFNLEDLRHKSALAFADEVRTKTNGEVDIVVHPLSQMGGLRDSVEGTRLGTIDLTMADTATIGNWAPALGMWSLPFIFNDYDHAQRVMAGPVGEWRTKEIRSKAGLVALGHAVVGFRVMLTSKRAVNSAADIRQMKLRVPEIPIYVSTFRALGANVTPVPWGEVYSALQAGVVEGVESNPSSFILAKHVEVTKFASRTQHILLDSGLLMNPDRFGALPRDTQAIIAAAAKRHVTDSLSKQQIALETGAWNDLAKWATLNPNPELASFRTAVAPVVEDFSKRNGLGEILAKVGAAK
ncbi:TRAP transporter substrate-binding protein [Thermomonas sp.]|uniref:TRAP transporter substrate-binding protein n=1 Tax=Thermomonas sp. TaxID=1971895 RepID=UPI002489261A|nr:TRAP transporter substrate-binding protein [Thermomonas sp.]MDI1251585.1 TRAP transporter substrate-binding protein [Thermomonas sp.]